MILLIVKNNHVLQNHTTMENHVSGGITVCIL